ncbi:MAG: cobyric acid synthase [Nitrospiraceae bacterium]
MNKFRGDVRLFADGVAYLESRTRLPVFGTLPFLRDLDMDQEDSVQIERHRHTAFTPQHVNVAVILLPRMSNFTDFNILAAEHDVVLRYASSSLDIAGADVVILPGSKNTIADLDHVYTHGFVESLKRHVERGGEVVGICGGYQMLGCSISDPHATEAGGCMQGLGFLDIDTELLTQKTTIQVEATPLLLNGEMLGSVSGYQIHMGVTERHSGQPCFQIRRAVGRVVKEDDMDGAAREDGLVWGTYIHGVFDQPEFRRAWLNRLRQRKGLPPLNTEVSELVSQRRESELDRWADHMQKHLDLNPLRETLRLG